jgi:hypothetical protein
MSTRGEMKEPLRAAQREWRCPTLRKLPIAATASSTKPGGNNNDGGAGGKGEVAGDLS